MKSDPQTSVTCHQRVSNIFFPLLCKDKRAAGWLLRWPPVPLSPGCASTLCPAGASCPCGGAGQPRVTLRIQRFDTTACPALAQVLTTSRSTCKEPAELNAQSSTWHQSKPLTAQSPTAAAREIVSESRAYPMSSKALMLKTRLRYLNVVSFPSTGASLWSFTLLTSLIYIFRLRGMGTL